MLEESCLSHRAVKTWRKILFWVLSVSMFPMSCDNMQIKDEHSQEENVLLCCGLALWLDVGESIGR